MRHRSTIRPGVTLVLVRRLFRSASAPIVSCVSWAAVAWAAFSLRRRDGALSATRGRQGARPVGLRRRRRPPLRDEVRILASLEHPGIARFIDGGRAHDGSWFLALEHVEGEDLIAHVASRHSPCASASSCSSRSSTPWSSRTSTASSTAISSRPTSWWGATGGRGCSISASPSSSTRTARRRGASPAPACGR